MQDPTSLGARRSVADTFSLRDESAHDSTSEDGDFIERRFGE